MRCPRPRVEASSSGSPRSPRQSAARSAVCTPTIVAGVVMVVEALELFDLDAIVVSDHDILRGAALEVVHRARPNGEVDPPS